MFSTFTPTQRFGTMMLTMLCVGAAGELIWMPALLAGPLGKYFEPDMPNKKVRLPQPESAALEGAVMEATPESTRMQLDAPHTASRGHAVRRDTAH